MKALLLIAHGSRRKESNDEVFLLVEKLKMNCAEQYNIVEGCFLEIAAPLMPIGIKNCIDAGATSITILPYFLNSGNHVVEDIPNIVNQIKPLHPDVEIKIAEHIGASDALTDLLMMLAISVN